MKRSSMLTLLASSPLALLLPKIAVPIEEEPNIDVRWANTWITNWKYAIMYEAEIAKDTIRVHPAIVSVRNRLTNEVVRVPSYTGRFAEQAFRNWKGWNNFVRMVGQ